MASVMALAVSALRAHSTFSTANSASVTPTGLLTTPKPFQHYKHSAYCDRQRAYKCQSLIKCPGSKTNLDLASGGPTVEGTCLPAPDASDEKCNLSLVAPTVRQHAGSLWAFALEDVSRFLKISNLLSETPSNHR